MGKRSKRPGRAARDVHAVIREQAAHLKATPGLRISDADEFPECAALLHAARHRVESSIPTAVVFEGRRYWIRARLALQLELFDKPGAAEPMLVGATVTHEGFGHVPGH